MSKIQANDAVCEGVPLRAAARRTGLTIAALRQRIRRGTIRHRKSRSGQLYVHPADVQAIETACTDWQGRAV
jgi:multisubunit Na+/H+ antiporter MnhE subunit